LVFQYSPVKAYSVPACWVTSYWMGVSRSRSSASSGVIG
jgi:hypothetical protein